jgi:hypothetical protein
VCHCVPCQRRTGAIMHSGAIFLKSQVRIEGASKVYARNADSGYEVRFHFCPNCGSNTYYEFDRSPDECGVPVGAFADPNFIRPAMSNNGRVLRRSKIRRAMSFWVNSRHRSTSASCPLYPQKRTSELSRGMSALCQKQTLCSAAIHGDFRTHPVGLNLVESQEIACTPNV